MIAFATKLPGKFPNDPESRIMEGVNKFLAGKGTSTNFYKTYQEWYEYLSKRLCYDIPHECKDFSLIKLRSTKLSYITKEEGLIVLILHPENANDVLQMTRKDNFTWESTPIQVFKWKDGPWDTYSLIAFATKAPGKFPNHQETRIMGGVWKFFDGKESPNDVYKFYREWYEDLSLRLLPDESGMKYSGYAFMKRKTNEALYSFRDDSYAGVYILHKTEAEKTLEMNKSNDGCWVSKVPEGCRSLIKTYADNTTNEFILMAVKDR